MAKPEATEHFPWGERAIKVKGKVFVFMYADATQLSVTTKLPRSGGVALMLPFATPTGYGLGKAGWVSAKFGKGAMPPVEMLCDWIDESYQAVAPAKLAAVARESPPAEPAGPAPRTRRSPAKRAAVPARRATTKRAAAPTRRPAGRRAAAKKRSSSKRS
jgi:predicted DNA-binding protein (MmcQ/YjbR family)